MKQNKHRWFSGKILVFYKKWKIKKLLLLTCNLLHTLNLFVSNKVCFFFMSLMFWACTEACTCDLTPHMRKPDVCLSVCAVLYTGLFSSQYTSLGYRTQTPNLSKVQNDNSSKNRQMTFHALVPQCALSVLSYSECKIAKIFQGFSPCYTL